MRKEKREPRVPSWNKRELRSVREEDKAQIGNKERKATDLQTNTRRDTREQESPSVRVYAGQPLRRSSSRVNANETTGVPVNHHCHRRRRSTVSILRFGPDDRSMTFRRKNLSPPCSTHKRSLVFGKTNGVCKNRYRLEFPIFRFHSFLLVLRRLQLCRRGFSTIRWIVTQRLDIEER